MRLPWMHIASNAEIRRTLHSASHRSGADLCRRNWLRTNCYRLCALHDVVEDTEVTLDEIQEQFGERIAKIVDGLTKLDSSYTSESPQAENFKKVLSTLVEDVRVVLIKMADRLHNMRTLGAMPRHKQLKIAAETSYIYAPLAHRLGLYAIKTEFEDLCMKITDPDTYFEIAKKLQDTKDERSRYINEFIKPLTKTWIRSVFPTVFSGVPNLSTRSGTRSKPKRSPLKRSSTFLLYGSSWMWR
jgi:guanosine-3',5'-bis(diphosphate) 3'-pyrophosphohydrolase